MEDLDSTQALLDSTIPTPTIVDSVAQDSEEDEIFFGQVSDKETKKSKKFKRRDTVCLSGSVSEWRKMNVKDMSRDSLLSTSTSSSNRRSSLLSQENSITEESEDDVFTEEHASMDTEEDMDEVEIATNQDNDNGAHHKVLDWTTSDVVSVDNDISGVEPLEVTADTDVKVISDRSRDCVYDSFSEDTGEESLDMEDSADEEAQKLEHAKRKILQDSTILSVSSVSNEPETCLREMEFHSADAEETTEAPKIIITEASVIAQDNRHNDVSDALEDDDEKEIPNSPAVSEYFTAPSSRRTTSQGSISGIISPSFDTTAEEMALFEMFGEDYDEIVAAMSHKEKIELAEKIHGRDEEEIQAVAAKLKQFMEENNRLSFVGSSVASPLPEASPRPSVAETSLSSILPSSVDHVKDRLSIGSDVSPFSLASTATNTPSPALLERINEQDTEMEEAPSPNQLAPAMNSYLQNTSIFGVISSGEDINLDKTPIFTNPIDSSLEEEEPKRQKISEEDHGDVIKTPLKTSVENPVHGFSSNFMMPTTASLNKMIQSPSPRKPVSNAAAPVWLPPSPSPSKLSIGRVASHSVHLKSPHSSSAKRPAAVSRLPQPIRTPQRPAGVILTEISNSGLKTPSSVQKKAAGIKSAYAAVASPVASYVRNNPAPHLVQNVKAKEIDVLESTLVEVEEKENSARLSLLPACPLPSAVYKASSAMDEEESDSTKVVTATDYEYVTEAYGAVSCSAKVTKHVARVKMPNTGLTWNEDYLVNDESIGSSPSVAKFKQPAKSVLKMTRRDSGLFDESMMNVSVVETKVVKKVARAGRGRGKAKRK